MYPTPAVVTVTFVTAPTETPVAAAPDPVGDTRLNPLAVILLVAPTFALAVISFTMELLPDPEVMKIIGLTPVDASVAFVCIETERGLITYTK